MVNSGRRNDFRRWRSSTQSGSLAPNMVEAGDGMENATNLPDRLKKKNPYGEGDSGELLCDDAKKRWFVLAARYKFRGDFDPDFAGSCREMNCRARQLSPEKF